MIPVANSLIPSFAFIKVLNIIAALYKEANHLLKLILQTKIAEERFDAIHNVFFELNQISSLLSTCYQHFLLASIAAMFFMSLNLFYNLFLALNGIVHFSSMIILSTFFWIFFQKFIFSSYIIGCEKIRHETDVCAKLIWKFIKIEPETKKTNVRIRFNFQRFC